MALTRPAGLLDFELDLGPLTVLVGSRGSAKSQFSLLSPG